MITRSVTKSAVHVGAIGVITALVRGMVCLYTVAALRALLARVMADVDDVVDLTHAHGVAVATVLAVSTTRHNTALNLVTNLMTVRAIITKAPPWHTIPKGMHLVALVAKRAVSPLEETNLLGVVHTQTVVVTALLTVPALLDVLRLAVDMKTTTMMVAMAAVNVMAVLA